MELLLDHYDDNGEFLKTAADDVQQMFGVSPKALAETAVPVDKTNKVRFPDEEFALKAGAGADESRHFPMSDESNTLLSTIYFLANGEKLDDKVRKGVAARLSGRLEELGFAKAAEILGSYAGDEAGTAAVADPLAKKEAMPSVAPNLQFRGKKTPIRTEEELEAVASDIDAELHKLTAIERRDLALQLRSMGADLPPRVAAYASLEKNSDYRFYEESRYQQVREADKAVAYKALRKVAQLDDIEERIVALHKFDKDFGPFFGVADAVLSVTARPLRKTASAPKVAAYSELTIQKVAHILGSDVAETLRSGDVSALNNDVRDLVSRLHKEASTS